MRIQEAGLLSAKRKLIRQAIERQEMGSEVSAYFTMSVEQVKSYSAALRGTAAARGRHRLTRSRPARLAS